MPIILTGPLTGQELLEIDPVSEDPANSVLQLGPGTSYELTAVAFPGPPLDVGYASSVDTEGEIPGWRRYGNREITFTTEFVDAGGGLLAGLQVKVAKLQREGGTLRRTMKNGDVRIFDLVAADGWNPVFDVKYYLGDLVEVSVTLPARPLARTDSAVQPDRIQTTDPALIATETGIAGDVGGTGEIVIDNDNGTQNWWGVTFGLETDAHYAFTDSTGSGALAYDAESRTAMGGSAIAAGPAGASGAGSNVMRNTALATTYQAILSTQATGGGANLTHVGTFRVWARVQVPSTNAGTVMVGFEWALGDFRLFTPNDAERSLGVSLGGKWVLLDLGMLTLDQIPEGAMRWEGRIRAKSTVAGDDIDIDWLLLEPTANGWGTASASIRVATPTAFSARDEFDQTAGALTGKTAPAGGVWAGAGDATDFTVETAGHTAQRTEVSDASVQAGRFAISGAAAFAAQFVTVDVKLGQTIQDTIFGGPVARYTDTNNFVTAVLIPFDGGSGLAKLFVYQYVAGVQTTLANSTGGAPGSAAASIAYSPTAWYSLSMMITTDGRVFVWLTNQGAARPQTPYLVASSTALATGGALATGKPGFLDVYTTTVAVTRNYDNFAAWAPPADAGVFAGQSLAIRSDSVLREDSTGSYWQKPSSYIGSYLTVPPAGAEGHDCRYAIKPLYGPELATGVWLDDRIDDLSARLTYEARFL